MLEFKGITFEVMNPDPAEAIFCGLTFENHINNVSYFCGITFENKLELDSLDVLFFAQL
jgi:hypothetical protein